MSKEWYVLNSKPRKENLLWQQLKNRDLETFFPRLHVNPVNPRSYKVRPYFPGYLFVNVDLSDYGFSKIAWIPGLRRIVAFDGKPTKVSGVVVENLRIRLAQRRNAPDPAQEELRHGQPVHITDTRFEGYEAIFDTDLDGKGRVRVLLKLLSDQQIPLELPGENVKRK